MRYPRPRTARMQAASPSLPRSRDTYTSMAFGVSSSLQSLTALMSRLFATMRPALSTRHSSMDHSRCVSSSGRSPVARFLARDFESQRAELDGGLRHGVGAANECATTRHQLRDVKGLGQVVVGAEVERRHAIGHVHRAPSASSPAAPGGAARRLRNSCSPSSRGSPMSTTARSKFSACSAAARRAGTGDDVGGETGIEQPARTPSAISGFVFDDEHPHAGKPTQESAPSN